MFAVIRLRGTVKARKEVDDTLRMLNLRRKMHCVLLKDGESMKGMLNAVKDYITWGEISDEILKQMILKRGRKEGEKRLTDKEAADKG
jgi:large subunit ribosomal protein L30